MGTLTLTELKDEIRVHLANRTSEDSRLTRALNLAQMRISRIKKWEELELKITGTFTITSDQEADAVLDLSAQSIRDIYSIIVTDGGARGGKLKRIPSGQFDNLIGDQAASINTRGFPCKYTMWGKSKCEVYPSPESALTYKIRISKWADDFSDASPSAVSNLSEKDDMLITLAVSYLEHSLGKSENAARFFGMYKDMLKDAKLEEAERPDQLIAPDFELTDSMTDKYWADPFHNKGG